MERMKLYTDDDKGEVASKMFEKIQEIVEWINKQEEKYILKP